MGHPAPPLHSLTAASACGGDIELLSLALLGDRRLDRNRLCNATYVRGGKSSWHHPSPSANLNLQSVVDDDCPVSQGAHFTQTKLQGRALLLCTTSQRKKEGRNERKEERRSTRRRRKLHAVPSASTISGERPRHEGMRKRDREMEGGRGQGEANGRETAA